MLENTEVEKSIKTQERACNEISLGSTARFAIEAENNNKHSLPQYLPVAEMLLQQDPSQDIPNFGSKVQEHESFARGDNSAQMGKQTRNLLQKYNKP